MSRGNFERKVSRLETVVRPGRRPPIIQICFIGPGPKEEYSLFMQGEQQEWRWPNGALLTKEEVARASAPAAPDSVTPS